MTESFKRCPFCAEQIQFDAKKCRFCGEFLDTSRNQPPSLSREVDSFARAGKAFLQSVSTSHPHKKVSPSRARFAIAGGIFDIILGTIMLPFVPPGGIAFILLGVFFLVTGVIAKNK